MDPQLWPDLLELKESRRGMDAGGLIAMHLSICIKGDVIKIKVSITMLMYTQCKNNSKHIKITKSKPYILSAITAQTVSQIVALHSQVTLFIKCRV